MSRTVFLSYLNETDARTDPHFHSYRVETSALRRLRSPSDGAFLAIGLKGVGKTASFLSLQSAKDADLTLAISADTQEPHEIATSRPTLQYVPELRTELVLQVLSTFLEQSKKHRALARKVPEDLQQEMSVVVKAVWEKVKNVLDEVGGISFFGFGISRRSRDKKHARFRLATRSEYETALDLLKRLSKVIKVRVVIDDPEAIFAADERVNENLIAALAIAAHELNKAVSSFKCIILIKPNILQALRKVDEFVNLPHDSRVRLSWTDDELKSVIRLRAEAASVDLKKIFRCDPEPALATIVNDSRSGPRDALSRLLLQLSTYPDVAVTPDALEKTIGTYSEACYEQMYGPYERLFPGIARASIVLFEGREGSLPKLELRNRLDEMIATKKEILEHKNEKWARDPSYFGDLLVQFGLIAIGKSPTLVLPFHSNYLDQAAMSDAIFSPIPGLRGIVGNLQNLDQQTTAHRKADSC